MKILMVSMNSIHFLRWTEQLKDSRHDVYWFDVRDGSPTEKLPWVHKINGWKLKYPNLKGRHFLKKRLPKLYARLSPIIENDTARAFEKVVLEIQPDVVHSFALYVACTPIFKVMQKHKDLKWTYSSWGSDLYYFKNIEKYKRDIVKVLPRIDYLFTDCKRDVSIAKRLGFKGMVLGTYPGGGGYDYAKHDKYVKTPVGERNMILVKGYQGRSGRCIEVLKALVELQRELEPYQVVVFGADKEVEGFISSEKVSQKINVMVHGIGAFMPHESIMKLMGEALLYIGNSNSDGMPNTLLEAIAQGAFPIQSNPGGASAEVIKQNENGLLIEDCEDVEHIKGLVSKALSNPDLMEKAFKVNQSEIKPRFEIANIRRQVLEAYDNITT